MREDVVRGVTGGAIRSNDEAFAKKSVAMDALRVVLEDPGLRNVPLFRDPCPLLVTPAADIRHLQWGDGRFAAADRQNIMAAVT
jgi:hypothetical protein